MRNMERLAHTKPRWSPKAGSFWRWLAPSHRSALRVNKQGGSAQGAYRCKKGSVCMWQRAGSEMVSEQTLSSLYVANFVVFRCIRTLSNTTGPCHS